MQVRINDITIWNVDYIHVANMAENVILHRPNGDICHLVDGTHLS